MIVAKIIEILQGMPRDYEVKHGLAIEPGGRVMGVTQVDYADNHYVVVS